MRRERWRVLALVATALLADGAAARDYQLSWGPGFDIRWDNKFAAGAQWRLAKRDQSLIGKSNLDPSLCAPDACLSLSRDNNEPHERWMAAPGAAWQIGDEANLAHDRGDMTSGVGRWRSELLVKGGDRSWGLKLTWQTFYDFILNNSNIANRNIIVAEGPAPGVERKVPIPRNAEDEVGFQIDLRQAFGFFRLPYAGDRELDVAIGRQYLGWGEALFAISGTLNFINPINFNNFFRPTMELNEALEPVSLLSLKSDVSNRLGVELFYQLEWRPYVLPSRGSLGSFIADIGTRAENAGNLSDDSFPLPFGKTPEDPRQLQRELTPVVALISESAASIPRLDNREPPSRGQYGLKLSWFEPDWSGGTELSLYYSNYHARLPAVSFLAADSTCAAAEGSATGEDPQPAPFPLGLINFMQACGRGDVTGLADLLVVLTGDNPRLVGEGFDALPISSARLFFEYPENIQVFGFGFNTSAFGVSLTGELAFRPDHPFQVDLEDVFFAALQPVFPRNELPLFPSEAALADPALAPLGELLGLPLDQLAGATFTDRRNALPDFLTAFRGGEPGEVEPGSYIRGFERFDYWQGSVGATWLYGKERRLLGSDQLVLLLELSASYVPDLPPLERLQLDSLATTNTHFTPGIEESGDPLKLNPFQADRDGFPTQLAWGYKAAAIWAYDDLWLDGLRLRPQLILFHDVDGTTPGLGGNFQYGRKIGLAGVNFNYRNRWSFSVDQFIFFGGGDGNRLRDRDFVNVAVAYEF